MSSIPCPECGQPVALAAGISLGETVTCPVCEQQFRVGLRNPAKLGQAAAPSSIQAAQLGAPAETSPVATGIGIGFGIVIGIIAATILLPMLLFCGSLGLVGLGEVRGPGAAAHQEATTPVPRPTAPPIAVREAPEPARGRQEEREAAEKTAAEQVAKLAGEKAQREADEKEAARLLASAKLSLSADREALGRSVLEEIGEKYPHTAAAKEAKVLLDKIKKLLPFDPGQGAAKRYPGTSPRNPRLLRLGPLLPRWKAPGRGSPRPALTAVKRCGRVLQPFTTAGRGS